MQHLVEHHEARFTRFLEILPGLLAWSLILFPLIGGFFVPNLVAVFLMMFIAYWFYKSFTTALLAVRGYHLVKEWKKINWHKKWLKEKDKAKLDWDEIKHVVIIPNYNESVSVLSRSLRGLKNQKQIDEQSLIVILAMEARAPGCKDRAKALQKKFKGEFGILHTTFHPPGLPGEIVGKASNGAWAAKKAKKLLDKNKISMKTTTVTSCDADAIFHPRYFAALTYAFTMSDHRELRIWQSPIFWYNNIHKVAFPVRLVGSSGHPVNLSNLQEPNKLNFNYSSYSLSFKLLHKVGYWHTDIIPEDWHLFLQAFFETNGKVQVEPIYLPTHIDAPESKTWWGTLANRYQQCKRHAWGATDIPYAIKESIRHKEIPIITRTARVYKMVEGHAIWSTNWFILTLGPLIPLLINPEFERTTLGHNLPKIARVILTICILALIVLIIVEMKLRPEKAKPKTFWAATKDVLIWVTMPIVTLPMSVLPGLHAQTMLMFGKRLEYKTTEKV